MTQEPTIQAAQLDDLDALVEIEEACFEIDRLSRRSFRAFLMSSRDELLVAQVDGRCVGYALLLFRSGTALARLYSIAVLPSIEGKGIGTKLFLKAEEMALARGCIFMRLEVRRDNISAIRLYRKFGYRLFDTVPDYYEDSETALRFERRLQANVRLPVMIPPYYRQTMDFTCGPACVMMALAWNNPKTPISRTLELRLWRESTTIFMTSGLGGCEPMGLAVMLRKYGLRPSIHVSHAGPYFLESVRSKEKKLVMRLTQEAFLQDAHDLEIPIAHTPLSLTQFAKIFDEGAIAIVLVSGYRMFRQKAPHWVLAFGHDDKHIFVHDPYVEISGFESLASAESIPIPHAEFVRMTRYGKDNLRAAIIIRKGNAS